MRAAIISVTLLLTGCASYSPEATVLFGPKRINGRTETGVTFMLIQRFGEKGHGACGWVHASDPQHGEPFNDDPEDFMDSAGCGVRFGGNSR